MQHLPFPSYPGLSGGVQDRVMCHSYAGFVWWFPRNQRCVHFNQSHPHMRRRQRGSWGDVMDVKHKFKYRMKSTEMQPTTIPWLNWIVRPGMTLIFANYANYLQVRWSDRPQGSRGWTAGRCEGGWQIHILCWAPDLAPKCSAHSCRRKLQSSKALQAGFTCFFNASSTSS